MKIVFVSSEVVPFSKSGGLGDVCGALPAALAARGHTVVTVSPRYGMVDRHAHEATDRNVEVGIHAAGFRHHVRFLESVRDGVHHLLVEHPMFDRPHLYGDKEGAYRDNPIRFSVLCRAAIEAARRVPINGTPLGDDVVFHAHDWHAALMPVFLEALYRPLGIMAWAPCVLTIHNIAHQGHFSGAVFHDLELAPRWFRPSSLEWYGDVNLLKGGILAADHITTVSPTFAKEIGTPQGGFGLDGVIRHRGSALTGILNGIDTQVWDPATDPHLEHNYDVSNWRQGKAACKAALQKELGLPVDPSVPMVGSVGRLDPQKGIELLIDSIPWLVEQGAQVVVLGSASAAHRSYEERLRALANAHSDQVRAWIGFSEPVAHRIEAACDIFAMPSRFEPCGLNQLYSMRYGAVPVVRATGGLTDSVPNADIHRGTGTGFTFKTFTAAALRDALYQALWTLRTQPEGFAGLVERGMRRDASWNLAAARYEEVYDTALSRRAAL